MIYICVICMDKRGPLMLLTTEHRQLLEAIVSPIINIASLNPTHFLLCKDCQVLMASVHAFQQTALTGIKHLEKLLQMISTKPSVVIPTDESKLKPLTIKPKVATSGLGGHFHDVSTHKPNAEPVRILPKAATTGPKGHFLEVVVSAQTSKPEPVRILPKVTGPGPGGHFPDVLAPAQKPNTVLLEIQPKVSTNQPSENSNVLAPAQKPNTVLLEIQPKVSTNQPSEHTNVVHTEPVAVKQEPDPELPVQGEPMFVAVPDPPSIVKEELDIKEEQQSDAERERDRDSESTLTCESDYGGPDDVPNYETKMPVISNVRSYSTDYGRSGKTEVFTHRAFGQSSVPAPPDPGKNSRKDKERYRVNYCFNSRKPKPKVNAKCEECGKVFTTRAKLRGHRERMHLLSPVECDECGKRFNSRNTLKSHKYFKHRDPRTIDNMRVELFCAECLIQFPTPSQYRDHMMSLKHVTRDQWSFECEHCQRRFPTEARLQHHMKCIHLNQKHKCSKCDKSYATQSSLRRHFKVVHEKSRRHGELDVCYICGASFTASKSLKEHLLRHSGARPHCCPLCPATFTYKAALYTHNRLKHLKIKGKWKKKTKKNKTAANVSEDKKYDDSQDSCQTEKSNVVDDIKSVQNV